MAKKTPIAHELPPDNAARITLYDALAAAADSGGPGLSEDELCARVMSRLRILVPRELHVLGEQAYLNEKISVCDEAGLLKRHAGLIVLGDRRPQIAYPDGTIRDYTAGLQAAKERLEADDVALRQSPFDVRDIVGSVADEPGSDAFRALLASMRERGYVRELPILDSADGRVVDGRARLAAAEIVGVNVERHQIPSRRDTPLHHALLVLDANCTRIAEADRMAVYEAVQQVVRPWADIAADLEHTREWRLAQPRKYYAQLKVKKLRFRPEDQPKIQITTDGGRVMLRSLLEAAGLASYKYELLAPYVAMEDARTTFTPGRTAIFVGVSDAISGIGEMQRDRRKNKRKVDREWDDIRKWLITIAGAASDNNGSAVEATPIGDAPPATESGT